MKKTASLIVLALVLASMLVMIGCESNDDDSDSTAGSDLTVTPSSATIAALAVSNVLFTAANGIGTYTWTIDSAALGTLTISGNTAIYTSTTNVGINYIHVVDSSNNTATASINHQ